MYTDNIDPPLNHFSTEECENDQNDHEDRENDLHSRHEILEEFLERIFHTASIEKTRICEVFWLKKEIHYNRARS
jgi:hypothetical protein